MGSLDLKFGVLGGTSLKEGTSGGDILNTLKGICSEIDTAKSLKVRISAVLDDKVAGNIAKQIKDAEKAADDVAKTRKKKEEAENRRNIQKTISEYEKLYKRVRDLENQLDRTNLSSAEREKYEAEREHKQAIVDLLKEQIEKTKELNSVLGKEENIDLQAESAGAHIISGDLRKSINEYIQLYKSVNALKSEKAFLPKTSPLNEALSKEIAVKKERMKQLLEAIQDDKRLEKELKGRKGIAAAEFGTMSSKAAFRQEEANAKVVLSLYKEIEQAKLKYGTDPQGKVLLAEAEAEVQAKHDVMEALQEQISDTKILADLEQKRLLIDKEIASQRAAGAGKADLAAQQKAASEALKHYKEYSTYKEKSLTAPEEQRQVYADAANYHKQILENTKREISDATILKDLYKEINSIRSDREVSVSAKTATGAATAEAKQLREKAKAIKEYAALYKKTQVLDAEINRGARGDAEISKGRLEDQRAELREMKQKAEQQGWIEDLKKEEERINKELLSDEEKLAKKSEKRAETLDDYSKIYRSIAEYRQKVEGALKQKSPQQYEELLAMEKAAREGKYEGGAGKLSEDLARLQGNIAFAQSNVEGFAQRVRRIFSDKYVYGVIAMAALYARRLVREVYQNVQEIDNAMTQLSIVTGQTGGELEASFDRAANSAKKLGSSITDLLGSMETFARLGYDMDQSQMLAEVATMMSKVAAVDVSEATTGLTSIIKGFGLTPEDAEYVGDVLSNIGKKYAVSAGELIEAFERSGAAFKASGTDFEKATALIAAGNAAVDFCRVA